MARFSRGMRRVVGASARHRHLDDALAHALLDRGFLLPRHSLQLPALHGDDLSRLPHPRGIREIQAGHPARHSADGPDGRAAAHLPLAASVGFHALYLLEPLALHRPELRLADDVRAARRREHDAERAPLDSHRIHCGLPDAARQFRNRRLGRSARSVARHPREVHAARAARSRCCVRRRHLHWLPPVNLAQQLGGDGGSAHPGPHAISLVRVCRRCSNCTPPIKSRKHATAAASWRSFIPRNICGSPATTSSARRAPPASRAGAWRPISSR